MKNVMLDQQTMLATWQQHTYAEFVLKDADAARATMTENPSVLRCSDELSYTALLPASSKRSLGILPNAGDLCLKATGAGSSRGGPTLCGPTAQLRDGRGRRACAPVAGFAMRASLPRGPTVAGGESRSV